MPENSKPPLIGQLGLESGALRGETVIVTGAGGGIGYEAARALLWLGANVVIAEINSLTGLAAAESLGTAFDPARVLFVQTDVGDPQSVKNLAEQIGRRFGKVDGVINNATLAVLGAVKDLPIEAWDDSYRVNLRGPVLMAQTFLPGMLARDHGVFVCVSSTGTAFLGGYETFKAAQVHLANTLDAELEGTSVTALTIGPGLVPTETARQAVAKLAPLMGMTVDEFFEMNKNAVLTVEEAGTGFALAVLYADRFRGQEISSLQAIKAANIHYGPASPQEAQTVASGDTRRQAFTLCQAVSRTLAEQVEGWKKRSLFERQWVLRDFKKVAGWPVEEWLDSLSRLESALGGSGQVSVPPLWKLAGYYEHLAELAKGYEKDPAKLEANLRHISSWKADVDRLEDMLRSPVAE